MCYYPAHSYKMVKVYVMGSRVDFRNHQLEPSQKVTFQLLAGKDDKKTQQ